MKPSRDCCIAALVFALGFAAAAVYSATWGGAPLFWRSTTFMQGLWWVCGQGWANPDVYQVPGLAQFLDGAADCFDCAGIPPGVAVLPEDTSGMTFDEINAFHPQPQFAGFLPWQRYHLYLVLSVTAMWWLFGVCWSALAPLSGLLYGAACALGYGVFRLGMRRPLAFAGALLLVVSPLHLQMAPHLRDYAKAPFTMAVLLLLGLVVRAPARPRTLLLRSALCGAAIGIGAGFRTDTMVALPAALVAVLVFLPGRLRDTWRNRIGAAAAVLAAFAAAGYPILAATFEESGHFAHVALLGFLEFCDRRLGVHAALYQLGDPFTDFYLAAVVQSYMHRIHGTMPPSWVMMPPYHAATDLYLREYLATFPADVVYRAYTAVLRILDELRPDPHAPWPRGLAHPALHALYGARAPIVDHLPGGGRYYAAAALALIAARNLRAGFAALFLLLWFAGYPSIQFNTRHAFHLEILPLFAALFLLQSALDGARALRRMPPGRSLRDAWRMPARRVAIFASIAALGLWLPLLPLRAWQHARVGALVDAVEAAARTPLGFERMPAANGMVRVRVRDLREPPAQRGLPVQYAYLALEFAPGAHGETLAATFAYEAENAEHYDWTRTVPVEIPAGDASTVLYMPLYYAAEARWLGLDLPEAQAARLRGVARLDTADALPLWLTLHVPPAWRDLPRRQTRTR